MRSPELKKYVISAIALILGLAVPYLIAYRISKYNDFLENKRLARIEKSMVDSLNNAQVAEAVNVAQPLMASQDAEEFTSPISPFQVQNPGNKTTTSLSAKEANLNKSKFEGQLILLAIILIIILFVIRIRYRTSPKLIDPFDNDQDPEELKEMFGLYLEDIRKLGTPRKIKRFFNKVRVQYNLLNKMQLMDTDHLKYFFNMLLRIEQQRKLVLSDDFQIFIRDYGIAFDGLKNDGGKVLQDVLEKYINEKHINQTFTKQIFELNRNTFI